jgi:hypothetical protein
MYNLYIAETLVLMETLKPGTYFLLLGVIFQAENVHSVVGRLTLQGEMQNSPFACQRPTVSEKGKSMNSGPLFPNGN